MATVTAVIRGQEPPARSRARLQIPGTVVTLPWWPSGIAWEDLSDTWTQQNRPGRDPLLLRSSRKLATLRIDATIGTDFREPVSQMIQDLRKIARSKKPVTLWLGNVARGQWRITDFAVTEREWAKDGSASIADIEVILTRLSDAAIPMGPVKGKK